MSAGRFAAASLVAVALLFGLTADAQRNKPRKPPATTKIEVGAKDGGVVATEPVKANPDGGVVEAKTLAGGTRVFRFGEMEVEGRSCPDKSCTSFGACAPSSRRVTWVTGASWAS